MKNKRLLIAITCLTIASVLILIPRTGMDTYIIGAISVMGALALGGIFRNMEGGFGPTNLRAIGIVLVSVFASLLGMGDGGSLTAAMGILGAIVGYLFGVKDNITASGDDL